MSTCYQLIDHQRFAEDGLHAEVFAEMYGPDNVANGDLLVDVPGRPNEMFGIMQRIVVGSNAADSSICTKLVVAQVKLGKVSNIVNPAGARQTFSSS